MSVTSWLYSAFLEPAREFIFPPVCLTCGELRSDRKIRICGGCLSAFAKVRPGDPVWQELRFRFNEERLVEEFYAPFLFEQKGRLQEAIYFLKYRGYSGVGVELGREIGAGLPELPAFAGADVLVPVPLHRTKIRERGFNQAETIARGISEVTSIPYDVNLVVRKRNTPSQTKLSAGERKENVGGAFVLAAGAGPTVRGKVVVIVDDVITTGATISACAAALAAGGAMHIHAVSVALAE